MDDFAYDEQAGTLTCPNQVTRPPLEDTDRHLRQDLCWVSPAEAVHHLSDRSCDQADRVRAVRRDHRARAKEPDFQQVYRAKRPLVDSIAWLTRGNRRLRYRRVVKNNAWLHHRSGSVEPTSTPHLGTHLDDGTWALA